MRYRGLVGVMAGVILAAALGCSRPIALRDGSETVEPEPAPTARTASYYNRQSGKAPAQRLESIGQPKKRVLVLDFWNDTPVRHGELGEYSANELRRLLHSTQRLLLPAELKSDLNTEDFVQGEKIKVAQLIREGRRLGVGVLIIGRITKAIFRQKGDEVGLLRKKQSLAGVEVELKVFDVAQGRELMSSAKIGEAAASALVVLQGAKIESAEYRGELLKLAVSNAVEPFVPEILRAVEKMAWEGRIVKMAGAKVYINSGRNSGLIGGDILKVLTPGDDIFDPVTGAFLGRSPGQLKGTLEIVDFIDPDGAVAVMHTGGNFLEGDIVQLY